MRLSPHFTLEEMTASQYATRTGIDNDPPTAVITNLERLCADVLEPLRRVVNAPIVISSGYRSPALNRAVGGSGGSAHMFGLAADLIVPEWTIRKVCQQFLLHRIQFDQLIDEFGRWVHVSLAPRDSKNRGHQLEARRSGARGVSYVPVSFISG
jgi:zinc D-Ala-D-Ala carboxypeptidase